MGSEEGLMTSEDVQLTFRQAQGRLFSLNLSNRAKQVEPDTEQSMGIQALDSNSMNMLFRVWSVPAKFFNVMKGSLLSLIHAGIFWTITVVGFIQIEAASAPSQSLHAFYYPWYGNPQTDGDYVQWNHGVAIRKGPPRSFPGGNDIGANFYPSLGCYSNNDDATLITHMRQLKKAGVGVICVSWWGKDSFTDKSLPRLFRVAGEHGIKINFHFEPHLGPGGRNVSLVKEGIVYLIDRFGTEPALYRDPKRGGRPMIYVYDSYLTQAEEWASMLAPDGSLTIRRTPYDTVVIGLWVSQKEERFMLDGYFDGFYTYFASDGFTFGSTPSNWPAIQAWARQHNKLFIPCVAPGYNDTRIRPWNHRNTREREKGGYYDRMFEAAIGIHPEVIAITSFNEWHEGTQIEPAIPKKVDNYQYEDYLPLPSEWYLDRTAYWLEKFR
jgi:glycoprotein endo-alpha-1,2-mannosidase